jgi:hypothetical protein
MRAPIIPLLIESPVRQQNSWVYPAAFWVIVVIYCLIYAPFGLNDTDSGFITSLAWQVLSGKTLYTEVTYVRPPMSVWMRMLELKLLPEHLQIIGERYFFYLKMAAISYFAAACLSKGDRRWQLATLNFVIGVHCYPPAAWHTIDGLLFATFALWLSNSARLLCNFFTGVIMMAAILSKQVFWIMPVAMWFYWITAIQLKRDSMAFVVGFVLTYVLFWCVMQQNGSYDAYWNLTSASTNFAQLLQHGLFDYFDWYLLALPFVLLLLINRYKLIHVEIHVVLGLSLVLLGFIGVYLWQIHSRDTYTAPFAAARFLHILAVFYLFFHGFVLKKRPNPAFIAITVLVSISWASSVSWGYNLPIFLPIAGIYALHQMFRRALFPDGGLHHTDEQIIESLIGEAPNKRASKIRRETYAIERENIVEGLKEKSKVIGTFGGHLLYWIFLIILLFVFRYAYMHVYRDGRRSQMHMEMGQIYPQLSGIYSDEGTFKKYSELKQLQTAYPNATTLPTVTLADYLAKQRPQLPLNWVVTREFGKPEQWQPLLDQCRGKVFLIEKEMLERVQIEPEFIFTKMVLEQSNLVADNDWFRVVKVTE